MTKYWQNDRDESLLGPDPDFTLMMIKEIVEYNLYTMNVTELQYWAKRALMDKWDGAPDYMVELEYNSLLGIKENDK